MVVVALLCLAANVYLIIYYQHPEDRNQAWFPKLIVLLGMQIAVLTVLMFPLDVGNTRACSATFASECKYSLPMKVRAGQCAACWRPSVPHADLAAARVPRAAEPVAGVLVDGRDLRLHHLPVRNVLL